jgi:hypothetical protein
MSARGGRQWERGPFRQAPAIEIVTHNEHVLRRKRAREKIASYKLSRGLTSACIGGIRREEW